MSAIMPGHMAPSPGAFFPKSADFNGSSQYVTKGTEMTGVTDGKLGILSFWFRFDGGDGSVQIMFRNLDGFIDLRKTAGNIITITGATTASSQILRMDTTGTFTAGAAWHHLMASWDLANGVGHLYVNGANAIDIATDNFTNNDIDYTKGGWWVGASSSPDRYFNGCFAEFFFTTGQYLDLSQKASQEKFRSPSGRPVSLGVDGRSVTGIPPQLYLKGPGASFGSNLGTGGAFSVINGPLSDGSISP